MKIAPNFDQFILFILLIFPGFISMHIYRLLMPAKDIDWKNSIFEALFYDLVDLMPVCKIAIHYVVVSTFYATICCIKKFNVRLNQQSHSIAH
jgi:hypothetical protein